jgi:hypothetical protein
MATSLSMRSHSSSTTGIQNSAASRRMPDWYEPIGLFTTFGGLACPRF